MTFKANFKEETRSTCLFFFNKNKPWDLCSFIVCTCFAVKCKNLSKQDTEPYL